MATLTWNPAGSFRRPGGLRSAFLWLLLTLLLAGAASYTHGSRYALVGHTSSPSADSQTIGPAADAVNVIHLAGPCVDPESAESDFSERRQAPRSEPVPLKTGAVDAPSLTYLDHRDMAGGGAGPPEPDLPALTVVELSLSRT